MAAYKLGVGWCIKQDFEYPAGVIQALKRIFVSTIKII